MRHLEARCIEISRDRVLSRFKKLGAQIGTVVADVGLAQFDDGSNLVTLQISDRERSDFLSLYCPNNLGDC